MRTARRTRRPLFATSLPAFGLVLTGVLSGVLAAPASAVELQLQWQQGQKLFYDLDLEGVANVQIANDVPFLLAGVPLEIALSGDGRAVFETVRVEDDGSGVVTLDVPSLDVQASTFGQKATFKIANGEQTANIAGREVNRRRLPAPEAQSRVAVKITRDGKFVGIERLAPLSPAVAPANPEDKDVTTVDQRASMLASMLMRVLPQLLPGRDVQPGESWRAVVDMPVNPADTTGEIRPPLGEFDLTLRGEEEVKGQKLWRIAMQGKIAAPTATEELQIGPVRVENATLELNGDVWFDAAAGQIARGEIALETRAQAKNATPRTGAPAGATRPAPRANTPDGQSSWFDLTATLRMERAAPVGAPTATLK